MYVNKVIGLKKSNCAVKNNQNTVPSQTVPSSPSHPPCDTFSFRGGITHGINSSRKWIDYGNIFVPGAILSGRVLKKAKADPAKLMNADLLGAKITKSTFHCTNFTNANLKGTDFENSALDGSWFIDVITNSTNFKTPYLMMALVQIHMVCFIFTHHLHIMV